MVEEFAIQTSREYLRRLASSPVSGRFSGSGAAEFNEWKQQFIRRLSGLFAVYDGTSNYIVPELHIVRETGWHECKRIDLRYKNPEYNLNVPAVVLEPPPNKNNGAGIVCQHGHGEWGRLSVIGDRSNAETAREIDHYKYDYGLYFAHNGYTIIAIDLLGFGERTEPRSSLQSSTHRDPCDALGLFMLQYGRDLQVQQISDMRFAISILASWKGVDPERIGMAGLIHGGRTTMYATALDERIKVSVPSGICNTFADRTATWAGLCGAQIIPGIMPRADTPDIFASIAPRPLKFQVGSNDPLMVSEATENCIEHVQHCFLAGGAEERVSVDWFDGVHQFRHEPAGQWFDRWLLNEKGVDSHA